jgi:general secretion pathway protein C
MKIRIPRVGFTVIHLVFLALTAWVMAGGVSSFVADRFVPPRSAGAYAPSAGATPSVKPKEIFTGSLGRNIFNSALGPEDISQISEADITGALGSDGGLGATVPKTTLGLKLIGTVIDPLGMYRLAAIEVKETKEQKLYKVQDTVLGAKVAMILRNRVILSRAGKMESLSAEFDEGGAGGKVAASSGMIGEDVSKLSESQYAVSKRYLDSQLASMSQLLTEVRAVPNLDKSGVTDGFKVFAIRKGSLFDKIGLQNNDVVKRINGIELDSAEKGLELFQALKNETAFNVDLMRKSQKTTMRFSVQ